MQPTPFVSPRTRTPLLRQDDLLVTPDGEESFPVEPSGVVRLDSHANGCELQREREIFDTLPVQGVSYFRPCVYGRMMAGLARYLQPGSDAGFRFAELGGGEGHCAGYVRKEVRTAETFVCDISRTTLDRADVELQRICADITGPIFAPGSLQAAAFWVSLHHVPGHQRIQALSEAFAALGEGGILILFEPNIDFVVRRLLYRSRLRHDVYFDEGETALDFVELASLARDAGFMELETVYLNPAYNPDFVRQLRRWWLFLPVVNGLSFIGRLIFWLQSGRHSSRMKLASLYGMAFFRKPSRA